MPTEKYIAKAKRLEVGDRLWSAGTWQNQEVVVVSVTDTESITDKVYRFNRDFKDGNGFVNRDLGWTLDYSFWYLE